MRGQFSPGFILTIRALAADMGTSIMPVRDALMRLVAENALKQLPNRSAQVPTTTLEEFEQLTEIRVRLEGMAAEMAAQRISNDEIEHINELNQQMRIAVQNGDAGRVLESNMELHFAVYGASRSALLLSFIESLWLRIGPLLVVPFRRMAIATEVFNDGIDNHQLLINALRGRDSAGAANAVVTDIKDAAEYFSKNTDIFD
jgi:DNA-binding GntR family transcriptional regulator